MAAAVDKAVVAFFARPMLAVAVTSVATGVAQVRR
jgi:hypothetical protein